MKHLLLLLTISCGMGADWNRDYIPIVPQQQMIIQPYYTLNYLPIVKQEIVMVPVVENGTFYYYYPSSRWVPQPEPWTPDPYSEWLRYRY